MNKKILILSVFVLLSLIGYSQQDVQFTQYMYNMSVINPAYTGSRTSLSMSMMGRTQWNGLDGAPRTISVAASGPIADRMGLGVTLLSDIIGPVKEESIYADYTYTINTSETGKLAFGAKLGATFQKIDFLSLSLDLEGDPLIDRDNLNQTYPNFGAGLFYYTEKFYAGFSMPNIIKSRHFEKENGFVSEASEEMHFFFNSGYVFDVSQDIKVRPSVMMKGTANTPISIDVAGNLLFYEIFELGVAWRVDSSVSGLFNFVLGKNMRLGYAYDHTLSNFSAYNSGSHEVFFLYGLEFRKNTTNSQRFF
ncbi:PorP/SprF family type IX secretion system membrane protein [Urechidicola vernalis]|uniref:Type IX secretion system membrane protein PorP/SprF n=1 Tax=Urechidicola vernalis TaxID=3075600 RepID=A0ABU2Y6Y8_9FLAO|nr:type IX secretion system membrane protein PorP/SprF [Urechidicola sp. P050]MDT0553973.1 type IX secretion system membrane protein PorP/SprF [Urechidicola sp. P050]